MASIEERLQRALSAVTSRLAVGAVLAFDVGGKRQVTLGAGFQDIGESQAARPDMLYQIGSQTKMLVSTGILLLVKDGMLALDADINALLPEARALTGGQRVSVAQLLNHSSGLGNYTELMLTRGWVLAGWPFPHYCDDDLLKLAATQGVAALPGERVSYCNTGYILLGRLIERLTGSASTDFLKRRILDPLGMTDTHFARNGEWPRVRTLTGGIVRPASPPGAAPQPDDPTDMSWASSAGDGISSVDQMLYFASALIGRGPSLGLALDDYMAAPVPQSEPWHYRYWVKQYGYGMSEFDIGGRSWWGHGGGTVSHWTATLFCPELDAAMSMAMTFVGDSTNRAKVEPIRDQLRLTLSLAAYEAERIATG